jgi:hypothetical protein
MPSGSCRHWSRHERIQILEWNNRSRERFQSGGHPIRLVPDQPQSAPRANVLAQDAQKGQWLLVPPQVTDFHNGIVDGPVDESTGAKPEVVCVKLSGLGRSSNSNTHQ